MACGDGEDDEVEQNLERDEYEYAVETGASGYEYDGTWIALYESQFYNPDTV